MAKPERPDIERDLRLPTLPVPRIVPPKSLLGRWFLKSKVDEPHGAESTHPWYRVLWLTGVDDFSTLGYQPGTRTAASLEPLLLSAYAWIITIVFIFTFTENVRERPDGIIIASIFTAAIIILSAIKGTADNNP